VEKPVEPIRKLIVPTVPVLPVIVQEVIEKVQGNEENELIGQLHAQVQALQAHEVKMQAHVELSWKQRDEERQASDNEIAHMKQELIDCQAEGARQKAELEAAAAARSLIVELQSKIESCEAELQAKKDELQSKSNECQYRMDKIGSLEVKLKMLMSTEQNNESDVQGLLEENEKLVRDLQQERNELVEVRTKLGRLQAQAVVKELEGADPEPKSRSRSKEKALEHESTLSDSESRSRSRSKERIERQKGPGDLLHALHSQSAQVVQQSKELSLAHDKKSNLQKKLSIAVEQLKMTVLENQALHQTLGELNQEVKLMASRLMAFSGSSGGCVADTDGGSGSTEFSLLQIQQRMQKAAFATGEVYLRLYQDAKMRQAQLIALQRNERGDMEDDKDETQQSVKPKEPGKDIPVTGHRADKRSTWEFECNFQSEERRTVVASTSRRRSAEIKQTTSTKDTVKGSQEAPLKSSHRQGFEQVPLKQEAQNSSKRRAAAPPLGMSQPQILTTPHRNQGIKDIERQPQCERARAKDIERQPQCENPSGTLVIGRKGMALLSSQSKERLSMKKIVSME
jgi:hypothetical protein